ncbi:hypothetical protein DFH08DRAFT_970175 [Mycena albidolilacea]|uniref:DUF6532 domain-containing protein n=1 Tax=Mycena albidolilacea TaxID=1033008 RepID=A0AAD6ZGD7_9AGAR|nr:hypothetical protein DFH08DRAFT_970175 [Mycena albidolilacea]
MLVIPASFSEARAASQDSDDDSMPELAPMSDNNADEGNLHFHDAMAKALTTISRSHHTSTASWSSGQDVIVPDTDIDELRSDAESEKEGKVVTEHKKVRKVSAARQEKADLEKLEVRPGVQVKESVVITDVPTRPESSWDMSVHITFPAPGKDICLNDQTEEVKSVLHGGIKLLKMALVIEDAYPPILSCTGLGKAYMLATTDNVPEAVHIKGRLAVKKVAVNIAPGHYKLAGLPPARTKQAIDLSKITVIFSPPIQFRIFTGQFKDNTQHLFVSMSKNHPKRLELPDPMVSLAATAIYAVLVEYRLTREHQNINFTEATYKDTYRNYMKTLADTCTYAPVALHKVHHALYNDVT